MKILDQFMHIRVKILSLTLSLIIVIIIIIIMIIIIIIKIITSDDKDRNSSKHIYDNKDQGSKHIRCMLIHAHTHTHIDNTSYYHSTRMENIQHKQRFVLFSLLFYRSNNITEPKRKN